MLPSDLKNYRYNYILQQKAHLSKVSLAASTFGTTSLAALTGAHWLLLDADRTLVSKDTLIFLSYLLLTAMILISIAVQAIIISGVSSWISYSDEQSLLESATSRTWRFVDFFRWYEIYVVLGIIIYMAFFTVGFFIFLIPELRS